MTGPLLEQGGECQAEVFVVHRPGIFSTLQNDGRRGRMHLGLTDGGAMDLPALRWANRLLDNPPAATAIEITLGGLVLEALAPAHIALSGADARARLDGKPLANWETHRIRAGQRLEFGHARRQMRAYLAVAGGLTGAAPTVPREGLGGLHNDGQPLRRGDRLFRQANAAPLPCRRLLPPPLRPLDDPARPLTFLPGGQWKNLPEATREALISTRWRIHSDSNRMATRLEGPPLVSLPGIRSEPLAPGSLQLPPDGRPLVLMSDRQTFGGYAVTGWLTPRSLCRLAQRHPGSTLQLVITDPHTARREWLELLELPGAFRA